MLPIKPFSFLSFISVFWSFFLANFSRYVIIYACVCFLCVCVCHGRFTMRRNFSRESWTSSATPTWWILLWMCTKTCTRTRRSHTVRICVIYIFNVTVHWWQWCYTTLMSSPRINWCTNTHVFYTVCYSLIVNHKTKYVKGTTALICDNYNISSKNNSDLHFAFHLCSVSEKISILITHYFDCWTSYYEGK